MERPGSVWREVRSLPRPVWLLYAGSFVNRFGSFVSVFLVLYLVSRGYGAAQAGLAVSGYGVGSLVSALVGGWVADRLGRRNATVLSMTAAAATALLLSRTTGLAPIVVVTSIFGFFSELYRPASAALLSDLVPAGGRLPAFAGYRLAINAGFAAGPAVAGFLAERSYQWLFVGEAATSLVFAGVALVGLPQGVRSRRGDEGPAEGLRAIRGDRRFQVVLVASVLAAFIYFQTESTLPLHVRDAGLSTAVYGILISLNGLLIVLLEFPLVGLTRRFPAPAMIALGVALSGIGFGLTAFAHSVPALVLTVVVWTFGEMIAAPVGSAYVAELAPQHLRGRYQGAFGLTFGVGLVLAPALGTRLYGVAPGLLWATCAGAGLLGAVLMLAGPGRHVTPQVTEEGLGPEVAGGPR